MQDEDKAVAAAKRAASMKALDGDLGFLVEQDVAASQGSSGIFMTCMTQWVVEAGA
jgi:hypothetical protein